MIHLSAHRPGSNQRATVSPHPKRPLAAKLFLAAAISFLAAANQVHGQEAQRQEATFSLNVPPEATLYVDNRLTPSTAPSPTGMRTFRTAPLPKGQWFFYDVRVVFFRGDREFSEKQRIYFVAGQKVNRSFMNLLNDADFKTYPRQFQIPAEMRVQDLRNQDDIRSFLVREKSRHVLSALLAVDAARLEDRDKLLNAVTEMDPLDIHPATISDVTYDRLETNLLKVAVEVRHSSKSYSTSTGRITVRDADRYYCTYRKVDGDWMMEKYWSLKSNTIGDAMLRWETALATNPPPRMAAEPTALAIRPITPSTRTAILP